ncbi:MAG TPA: hypothetical protein VFM54_08040 [Micromonosporaceae bacterium]|nr:hypothetical protein [Micromonosporaceae bacterium]
MTSRLANPLESSGSLTGHILAQGTADGPTPPSRTAKVVLIMLLVMVLLVAVGAAVAVIAGDTVTRFFDGITASG